MRAAPHTRATSRPDLDALMPVITRRAWTILGVFGGIIIAAIIWSIFGTVTTTVGASGAIGGPGTKLGPANAVVFVSQADGRQVQVGMPVSLSPLVVGGTSSVELHGTVKAVVSQVFGADQIAGIIGNDAFGRAIAGSNRNTPVVVQLAPSAALQQMIAQRRASATTILCEGHITTDDMHPISLISP